jgi:hypothetical protein
MKIVDIETGEGIPYATYIVTPPNGETIGGEADANGMLGDAFFNGYLGSQVTFSSAGYKPLTWSVNTALNMGEIELERSGALSEVFVTATRKIKENPGMTAVILVAIVLLIIYRKKVLSLFK